MINTVGVRPRFSVVIPVRNDADVVSRCVAGVLAQTFAAVEVLVVDAGSTDLSAEAVRAVADERVRLTHSSAEAGDFPGARRHGIERARGAWTLLLDPDDEVDAGWLARLGRLIDSTSAGFVSCGGVQRFSDGSEATIVPIEVPGRPGVRACLRSGSFAAPTERFRETDHALHSDPVNLGLELISVTLDAGKSVVFTPEALVRWNEPFQISGVEVDGVVETGDALRLRWAIQAIDAMALTPIPDGELLARYATIGGIAAARLGRRRQARRLFGVARSAVPGTPENWLRWAASCMPLNPGRIWPDTKLV